MMHRKWIFAGRNSIYSTINKQVLFIPCIHFVWHKRTQLFIVTLPRKPMTMKYLTIIFIVLTISSCRQTSMLTETERSQIIDSIRQTLHNYYADIRQKGLTAEFGYLDHSKDFCWIPPGYSTPISYDTVMAILIRKAPVYRSIDNTWDSLQINPLSHEVAAYSGRIHSSMTDSSGKTSVFALTETGFVIKRKDGWKLLSGQTSVSKPRAGN